MAEQDHVRHDGSAEHWLVRDGTIRMMWRGGIAILALLVALDLVVAHHPHFGVDGTLGFGAWYGFFACVALILLAKGLGYILKRPDDYYDC
ncbi:MAG: hypothetical protein AB1749_17180 [Pseudomonadota bacterium]